MKKFISYICSTIPLCILLYMLYICYKVFVGAHSEFKYADSIVWCFATFGWGLITYNVIVRKYAWLKTFASNKD